MKATALLTLHPSVSRYIEDYRNVPEACSLNGPYFVELEGFNGPMRLHGAFQADDGVPAMLMVSGEGIAPAQQPAYLARAIWTGTPAPAPKVTRHSNLSVSVYPKDFADRYKGGKPFIVQESMTAHAGFVSAAELDDWLLVRNLSLPGVASARDLDVGTLWAPLTGSYQFARHCNTLTFAEVAGVYTREWENGYITSAQRYVDSATGEVTIHAVSSNCSSRKVFDGPLFLGGDDRVAFYVPGDGHIFDAAVMRDGAWTGVYGGLTLKELRQEHPTMVLMYLAEAVDAIERTFRTEPTEISHEAYEQALCAVPALDLNAAVGAESFKSSELLCGQLTAIYAKLGDRYFTFVDRISTNHAEIIAKVEDSGLLRGAPPEYFEEELSRRAVP